MEKKDVQRKFCHSFIRNSLIPHFHRRNVECQNNFNAVSLPKISDNIECLLLDVLNSKSDKHVISNALMVNSAESSVEDTPTDPVADDQHLNFCSDEMCKTLSFQLPVLSSLSSSFDDAKKNVFWNKHPRGWQYSFRENDPSTILIGYVYQDDKGSTYIRDSEISFSCIFFCDSTDKHNANSFMCKVNSQPQGFIVALKCCYFLFERILTEGTTISSNACLLVPSSSVIVLHKARVVKNADDQQKGSMAENKTVKELTAIIASPNTEAEICDMFHHKLCLNPSMEDNTDLGPDLSYICEDIMVIVKAWSLVGNDLQYQSAFIVTGRKRILNAQNVEDVLNLLDDYSDINDNLTEQISKMSINCDKSQFILMFDSSSFDECARLLPRHQYYLIHPVGVMAGKEKKQNSKMITSLKHQIPTISFTKDMTLVHSKTCSYVNNLFENDQFGGIQTSSIREILTKKVITHSIIRTVLVDKFFCENKFYRKGSEDFEKVKKYTLCLVLKDEISNDSLRLYIPFYPDELPGILPGMYLMLYGCLCVCSQKNNLYLRASSSFGLQVWKYIWSEPTHVCENVAPLLSASNLPLSFAGRGFLLRVLHVTMFLMCPVCFRDRNVCENECDDILHIETSFEVDDGSSLSVMHCTGEDSRDLLKLSSKEWQFFLSHVKKSGEPLSFNSVDSSANHTNYVSKLLSLACHSYTLNRLISFQCSPYWVLSERSQLKREYHCSNIVEVQGDSAADLFAFLKKKESHL